MSAQASRFSYWQRLPVLKKITTVGRLIAGVIFAVLIYKYLMPVLHIPHPWSLIATFAWLIYWVWDVDDTLRHPNKRKR